MKIDVTPEAHALLKNYCKSQGCSVKYWASKTLVEAIDRDSKRIVGSKAAKTHKPIEKDPGHLMARPPFWKRNT